MKRFALILVLFLLACPPPYERKYGPLTGKITDSLGAGIEDIRVFTFELIDYPHPWTEKEAMIDSSISDHEGNWGMSRGYPWDAYTEGNGCYSSSIEDLASPVMFVLGTIDTNLDTTTYLLVDASYEYDIIFVDSIWKDPTLFYSSGEESEAPGSLLELPPIILGE